MLCQLCSDLDLAAIMRLRIQSRDFSTTSGIWEHNNMFQFHPRDAESQELENLLVPYHATMDDLRKASGTCDLCRVLEGSTTYTVSVLEKFDHRYQVASFRLFLCGHENGQGFQVMAQESLPQRNSYFLLGGIGFSVDKDSPFAAVITRRTLPVSLRSEDSLNCMEKWLSKCSSDHGHHSVSTMKPTRLLKYEPEAEKVFLCTSIPSDSTYAALSHCWGSVQPLTLNSSTYSQLEEGLPFEIFPQTFRDALWLTQQLNIHYLWIDSLCILQDSNKDWIHESARMADVYGNAYLTIAATKAKNCSEGFLGPRENPKYTDIPFQDNGIAGRVSIFPMRNQDVIWPHFVIELDEEPLSARAWALQERYLSPRTLHFARAQMYFECESFFDVQDQNCEPQDSLSFTIEKRETRTQYINDWLKYNWTFIVRRYTQRYLTVESDRLPAIGGLAARLSQEWTQEDGRHNDYLAGLWREDLLPHLCWQTKDRFTTREPPTAYTAPTWSWASVNYPVQYGVPHLMDYLAILNGAEVDLESAENPFGKVTGGWIHLSVMKLYLCDIQSKFIALIQEGDSRFTISITMDSPRYGMPAVSLEDYKDKMSELLIVPVYYQQVPEDENSDTLFGPHFLVLVASESSEGAIGNIPRFRRVGSAIALGGGHEEMSDGEMRRRLRERFLKEEKEGGLEDIIIL